MSVTYYTVDDLRPGRSGWNVRRFSVLAKAIDHYQTLPMNGVRVLGCEILDILKSKAQ